MKRQNAIDTTFVGGQELLARSALQLKKAWIVTAILAGHQVAGDEAVIPDYRTWARKNLQVHVDELEDDLRSVLGIILQRKPNRITSNTVKWLSDKFDQWQKNGFELLIVSTAHEFESVVGPLSARDVLDIPPYAQVLLQPGSEVTFRHPEYMLTRDLGLLYGLFRDAEEMLSTVDWSRPPEWAASASENALALGRATIQCCFNLLEAFTAGLARAALMTSKNRNEDVASQLRDTKSPLRKRLIRIPNILRTDKSPLDSNHSPFSTLFGDVKVRRDTFVHCEPGPEISERGYVKEDLFHDAFAPEVEKAVNATCEAIHVVWNHVYDRPRPHWFHERTADGRFSRKNLRLAVD